MMLSRFFSQVIAQLLLVMMYFSKGHLKSAFLLALGCALIYVLFAMINTVGLRTTTPSILSSHSLRFADYSSDGSASRCQPTKHIFYLKTHKTGSSTLVNILYRYGDNRNLTFVMPKERVWFDWPQRFHLFNTRPLYGSEANLLCCHTRYNKGAVNLLFPKEKAKYITTLRSPVSHFDSVFYWCNLHHHLGLSNHFNPLRTFLRAPLAFSKVPFHIEYRLIHLLRNPALFELGLDYKYFQNLSMVMSYIDYIDREFDLVLITDYYDESLILLKEVMCWDFQDIWYIKQKVRIQEDKIPISEEIRKNILSWNQADALLFDHFNKTFWRKISEMGPKFYKDLQTFRQQNKIIGDICMESVENNTLTSSNKHIRNKYKHLCKQMTRQEPDYIEYIKRKMETKWAVVDKTVPHENYGAPENSWYIGTDLLYKPVQATN